jgi:hypothetical protein
MCDVLESEPEPVAGGLQPRCTIDHGERVVDEMFFPELRERYLDQHL